MLPAELQEILSDIEATGSKDAAAWHDLHSIAQQRRLDLQAEVDAARKGKRIGTDPAMRPGEEPRSGDWYWGWEKAIDLAEKRKQTEAVHHEQARQERLALEEASMAPRGVQARQDRVLEMRAKHAKAYKVQDIAETRPQTLKLAMETAVDAYKAGDWEGAIQYFEQASVLDPAALVPMYGAGHALWQAGDIDGAVRQFAAAIDVDPDRTANRPHLKPWEEEPPDVPRYAVAGEGKNPDATPDTTPR